MICKPLILFGAFSCISCSQQQASPIITKPATENLGDVPDNPFKYISQIPLPEGFKRINTDINSFASWLRNIPLKENKVVYLYNGDQKANQSAQFAVMDISVGKKDLQQCADAVMRLRAEYLYDQKNFESIIFKDN